MIPAHATIFCCLMSTTNMTNVQLQALPEGGGGARAAARTKQGVLPPEQAMHHFRIVNLRSLYEADDARPRPALTIFVGWPRGVR